jgi:hypothetical protein
MIHARTTILEAFATAIRDARTIAGSRVYVHPRNDRTEFPALVIEEYGAKHSEGTATEAQGVIDMAGNIERRFRIAVVPEIQSTGNPVRDRNTLLAEVETAIEAAFQAGEITGAKQITPVGYAADDSDNSDRPIRRGVQVFEVKYFTPAGDPTTTL